MHVLRLTPKLTAFFSSFCAIGKLGTLHVCSAATYFSRREMLYCRGNVSLGFRKQTWCQQPEASAVVLTGAGLDLPHL